MRPRLLRTLLATSLAVTGLVWASTSPGAAIENGEDVAVAPTWSVRFTTVDRSSACTGTLISPTAVLTAAHCVYGDTNRFSNVELAANIIDDPATATAAIARGPGGAPIIHRHPCYDQSKENIVGALSLCDSNGRSAPASELVTNLYFDLAVIELAQAVPAEYVPLALAGDVEDLTAGPVEVHGYGLLADPSAGPTSSPTRLQRTPAGLMQLRTFIDPDTGELDESCLSERVVCADTLANETGVTRLWSGDSGSAWVRPQDGAPGAIVAVTSAELNHSDRDDTILIDDIGYAVGAATTGPNGAWIRSVANLYEPAVGDIYRHSGTKYIIDIDGYARPFDAAGLCSESGLVLPTAVFAQIPVNPNGISGCGSRATREDRCDTGGSRLTLLDGINYRVGAASASDAGVLLIEDGADVAEVRTGFHTQPDVVVLPSTEAQAAVLDNGTLVTIDDGEVAVAGVVVGEVDPGWTLIETNGTGDRLLLYDGSNAAVATVHDGGVDTLTFNWADPSRDTFAYPVAMDDSGTKILFSSNDPALHLGDDGLVLPVIALDNGQVTSPARSSRSSIEATDLSDDGTRIAGRSVGSGIVVDGAPVSLGVDGDLEVIVNVPAQSGPFVDDTGTAFLFEANREIQPNLSTVLYDASTGLIDLLPLEVGAATNVVRVGDAVRIQTASLLRQFPDIIRLGWFSGFARCGIDRAAVPDAITIDLRQSATIDVLANDIGVPQYPNLSITADELDADVITGEGPRPLLRIDGEEASQEGDFTITYQWCLWFSRCESADVTVTIVDPEPPLEITANPDTVTGAPGETVVVDVLANDRYDGLEFVGPAADVAELSVFSLELTTSINQDGDRPRIEVTLPSHSGLYVANYEVCVSLDCAFAQITVTVEEDDPEPLLVAVDDTASGQAGEVIVVDVLANDTYGPGLIEVYVDEEDAELFADTVDLDGQPAVEIELPEPGEYTLTYTICQDRACAVDARIFVTVENAPIDVCSPTGASSLGLSSITACTEIDTDVLGLRDEYLALGVGRLDDGRPGLLIQQDDGTLIPPRQTSQPNRPRQPAIYFGSGEAVAVSDDGRLIIGTLDAGARTCQVAFRDRPACAVYWTTYERQGGQLGVGGSKRANTLRGSGAGNDPDFMVTPTGITTIEAGVYEITGLNANGDPTPSITITL